MELNSILATLDQRQAAALRWFRDNAGTEQPWPKPLAENTLLLSKAKGIYKPAWTVYALSVRQALSGPYADRKPVIDPNGNWTYLYFQENTNPAQRDAAYTNQGLLRCQTDRIPVGVVIQVSGKPRVRYHVLGLGMVTDWRDGYFKIEGATPAFRSEKLNALAIRRTVAEDRDIEDLGVFDPSGLLDARQRILTSIVQRRGQRLFRRSVVNAYSHRCAISACDAIEVLEAAHIEPYREPETDHPSNGLLLRADLHVLFDLGLIAVDSSTLTVVLAASLKKSCYSEFAGKRISIPKLISHRPSRLALDQHRRWSGL